ncbi:hypothetical protein [Mollivirus kamchatka]|nr:hypothetical protein [Mollivirus kamchatka]
MQAMSSLVVDQDVETLALLLNNVSTDPDEVALRNRWIEESHVKLGPGGSMTKEVIRIYRLLWTGLSTRKHALGAISRHVSSQGGLWPPTPSMVLTFYDKMRRARFPPRKSLDLALMDCLDEIDMLHDSDSTIDLWAGRNDNKCSRYRSHYCVVSGTCSALLGKQRTIIFSVNEWSADMTPVYSVPASDRTVGGVRAVGPDQDLVSYPMMATFLDTLRGHGRHQPVPGHHEAWNHMCAFDNLDQAQAILALPYHLASIHESFFPGSYKILTIDGFSLRLALSLFGANVMAKNSEALFCHSLALSAVVARSGRIPYDAIDSLPTEAALAACPYLWRQICLQRPDSKGRLTDSHALLNIARLLDIETDEDQRQRPELIASIVGQCVIARLSQSIFNVPCPLPLPSKQYCSYADYEQWIKLAHDKTYLDGFARNWARSRGLRDVEKIARGHQLFGYAALAISTVLIDAYKS